MRYWIQVIFGETSVLLYNILPPKTVKISDGTTVIERRAFDACEALEKIEIPGTVETFEGHPLNRCDGVTSYAPAGSAAEDYANLYDINFKVA